ncbi:hypothetical protein GJ496_005666 [Pomphorhynchus laevis]|nr:hypothetical protein GJ496_005666 [Pomphorhynchus laevis]
MKLSIDLSDSSLQSTKNDVEKKVQNNSNRYCKSPLSLITTSLFICIGLLIIVTTAQVLNRSHYFKHSDVEIPIKSTLTKCMLLLDIDNYYQIVGQALLYYEFHDETDSIPLRNLFKLNPIIEGLYFNETRQDNSYSYNQISGMVHLNNKLKPGEYMLHIKLNSAITEKSQYNCFSLSSYGYQTTNISCITPGLSELKPESSSVEIILSTHSKTLMLVDRSDMWNYHIDDELDTLPYIHAIKSSSPIDFKAANQIYIVPVHNEQILKSSYFKILLFFENSIAASYTKNIRQNIEWVFQNYFNKVQVNSIRKNIIVFIVETNPEFIPADVIVLTIYDSVDLSKKVK